MRLIFERMAKLATEFAGSTLALTLAFIFIVIWTIYASFDDFSIGSQMVVNTVTTVCSFLMVFTIQRTQNKESTAVHLKLDELIASIAGASNRLLNIEDLSERDIEKLKRRYKSLAERTRGEDDKTSRHTVEEIE